MRSSTAFRLTVFVAGFAVCAAAALAGGPAADSTHQPSDTNTVSADTVAPAHQIIAYYFHGDKRCPTCIKLETYTGEAIDSAFADQLKSGDLVWRVINTDSAVNAHFVTDYQLYTKSVILSDVHAGEQTRWKNLEKIWELVGDRDKFHAYIRDEVAAFMKAD